MTAGESRSSRRERLDKLRESILHRKVLARHLPGLNGTFSGRWTRRQWAHASLFATLGALVAASAVHGLPGAAISFSIAFLLLGGLDDLTGPAKPHYRWLFFLMAILASGVPFSPSWGAAALIEGDLFPWGFLFAAAYAGCLAGVLSTRSAPPEELPPSVPGVRTIYIGGLILTAAGLVIAGWAPVLNVDPEPERWWGGGLVLLLTAGWLWLEERLPARLRFAVPALRLDRPAAWIRRLWRRGAGGAAFGLRLLARLLEGEAAMLWALVLLSLIVSLFVQLGLGV